MYGIENVPEFKLNFWKYVLTINRMRECIFSIFLFMRTSQTLSEFNLEIPN